jgi:hypothetical protein
MVYWTMVELVYIIDIIIFGYLAWFFIRRLKNQVGESRIVMQTMAILTSILFLQELYFGINTATDPNKLALAPGIFPAVSSVWIGAKLILTLGGIVIIYTLLKLRK